MTLLKVMPRRAIRLLPGAAAVQRALMARFCRRHLPACAASLRDDRISFVLPVATNVTGRDNADLTRLRILLLSLRRFFDCGQLDRFLIMTPRDDLARVADVVQTYFDDSRTDIVDETEIVPELCDAPPTVSEWPARNVGWVRQQLLKLAAADHVRTKHYVTLDADVICVRPSNMDDLITHGRARTNLQPESFYRERYTADWAQHEITVRRSRFANAARVLGVPCDSRHRTVFYGETPVVMDAAAVRVMTRYLEARAGCLWRDALLSRLPWTEYALYYLFLERSGLLGQVCELGDDNTVLRMRHTLFNAAERRRVSSGFDGWNPHEVFTPTEGAFVVLQSYLGIDLDGIDRACRPYLQPETVVDAFESAQM